MLMTTFLLPSEAQTQYISNSRLAAEDRFEDLGGDGGILLLSRHKDLVIALPNVKEKSIRLNGERPDGLYEYCVIVKANETRTPKLEISRRGNVYKTEIVLTIKPDFLMAFQVEEYRIRSEPTNRRWPMTLTWTLLPRCWNSLLQSKD